MCFLRVHGSDLGLAFYRDTLGGAIVLTDDQSCSPADSEAITALFTRGVLNGVHSNLDDTFEKVGNSGASLRSRM